MSIPYLCILLAYLLVYLPRFVVVTPAMVKGGYQNSEPREQQRGLEGSARRALAAHQNGFETFAPFAASVLMAQAGGVSAETIATWSIAYVVARVVFVGAYLLDQHAIRSVAWTAGFGVTLGLMAMAL